MTKDYDLVVIGHSPAGLHAAAKASRLGARVALVTQTPSEKQYLPLPSLEQVAHVLAELRQVDRAADFWQSLIASTAGSLSWPDTLTWTQRAATNLRERDSLAVLAAVGVDVIEGLGQFRRQSGLTFAVPDRVLQARAYLVTLPSRPLIPIIPGLDATPYQTLPDPCQWTTLPESVAIVGQHPTALSLAQSLTHFGREVTLITQEPRLLPQADQDTAQIVQASLEAAGVRILTQTQIEQVRSTATETTLQLESREITTESLVIAGAYQPDWKSLQLSEIGLTTNRQGIRTNRKCQTQIPQLYICSDQLHQMPCPAAAIAQADVVLQNVLGLPFHTFNEIGIPWTIPTDPEVATIGFTEAQALHRYGKDLCIVRQSLVELDQAQWSGATSGYGKLLVRSSGEIVGAQIVGRGAAALITVFSLAIQQHLKMSQLSQLPCATSSVADLVRRLTLEWDRLRLSKNLGHKDWLERWYSWRRSWF